MEEQGFSRGEGLQPNCLLLGLMKEAFHRRYSTKKINLLNKIIQFLCKVPRLQSWNMTFKKYALGFVSCAFHKNFDNCFLTEHLLVTIRKKMTELIFSLLSQSKLVFASFSFMTNDRISHRRSYFAPDSIFPVIFFKTLFPTKLQKSNH